MIQIEEISQKFTRIYHTVDDIKNFALRIRLIDETSPDDEDVSTFKWQQKRFSHQERERFQRAENCLTDLDKEYHQQILKETRRGRGTQHSISTIFSYVEKDGHTPPEINFTRKSRKNPTKPDNEDIQHNMLNKMMDKLYLHSKDEETDVEEEENEEKTKNFDYFDLLSENIKNPVLNMDFSDSTETKTFYIMADFGEYYNSTWLPSEYILCTISYNSQSKMLKITPDFTTFDGYQLKVTSDETKTYTYFIENASLDGVTRKNSEINKEVLILNQMNSSAKTNITHLQLEHVSWNLSKDTAYIHVVLEILSGWNFENDNVFVRYWLVLNGWQLKNVENSNGDNLQGVTIASKSCTNANRLHFGFPIEWHFIGNDYNTLNIDPVVYFELISKGSWSRFRTEGITQLSLPLGLPGRKVFQLPCCRTTSSGVTSELRRFFIGDCSNYQTLHQPVESGMNRLATTTISTGILQVSVSVLHVQKEFAQSVKSFENLREMRMRDKLRDPQLTKTVEDAVEAFKKARGAMLQAREAATTINKE